MTEISLSEESWLLAGWTPLSWETGRGMELGLNFRPEIGPVKAAVPGSVQKALFDHGIIPDWTKDLDSRSCEWVENREWIFSRIINRTWQNNATSLALHFEGLDGEGSVHVNKKLIGKFSNSFIPHRFDLSSFVQEDQLFLEVRFCPPPRWLGQFGYSSRIRDLKVRFNYTWDWLPRLVQIGICGSAKIVADADGEGLRVFTQGNSIVLGGFLAKATRFVLRKPDGAVHSERMISPADLAQPLIWPVAEAEQWHPNGEGIQPLYQLEATCNNAEGGTSWQRNWQLGFKEVCWTDCEGAPEGADPWICNVNGRPIFLKGVNWTPIRPNFADLGEEDYRQRIELYRDLGFNLFRVWGGGFLESEVFYRLCDEYGMLVWQEFPLCSSGLDNEPPTDPELISEFSKIAGSYITRRQSHVSLLCWCGGNELQNAPDGTPGAGRPLNVSHPVLAALAQQVQMLDPGRRFLPTSSSGPRFVADTAEFGKGVHWDVHGPWTSMEDAYWDHDDALFRSELGAPGASPADLINESLQTQSFFPISDANPVWQRFAFWLPDPADPEWRVFDENRDLHGFIQWSQKQQAVALERAVKACMRRFPRCGGVILWMGHDSFPCLSNTSVVDFHGRPKPAALALKKLFLG